MRTSSRERFWFSTAIIGTGALALLGGSFWMLQTIRDTSGVIRTAAVEFARLEQDTADADVAGAVLESLAREEALIRGSLVDAKNPLPFIEAIESLGKRLGLKVTLALANQNGSSYTVVASGPFSKVMDFFKSIEAFPFLVKFGNADLRASGIAGKGAEPVVELALIIEPLSN